ncbi:MAG TPA: isochorismatase family cysteine hydrolase [Spirochaetia bacterium]|nr:isochorismatase family cysteine hydrolase [Spirochaetia bacterium]
MVRVSRRLLLVIDMLRDFLDPGGGLDCGEAARGVIPFVREKVTAFRAAGDPVVFVCDAHEPDDQEFRRFPAHCVAGTPGAEVIEGLAAPGDTMIAKKRFSAFYGTGLEELLQRLQPEEIHVVGVCTNICVLYTVEELSNRDWKTFVYRDGVASFDGMAHRVALSQMEGVLGAELL